MRSIFTFSGVPVEEGLPPEHGGELLRDSLEDLLNGRRVADEGRAHRQVPRRHVADGRLHVVRNPLHEEPGFESTQFIQSS